MQKKYVGSNPILTAQWHPSKNGTLTPQNVSLYCGKKVWWKCSEGHEWEANVSNRSRNGTNCPQCVKANNRRRTQTIVSEKIEKMTIADSITLAVEWHPTKNGTLTPEEVTICSRKYQIWWKCKVGHEWQRTAYQRNNEKGCPFCRHFARSLLTVSPVVATQWHPTKNGDVTPGDVSQGQNEKAWWLCENGHEWESSINKRVKGQGCPYCNHKSVNSSNSLAAKYPDIAKLWHPNRNGELTPDQVFPMSNKTVWWQCQHGNEWKSMIQTRTRLDCNPCPICRPKNKAPKEVLSISHPHLAAQWHPEKNATLLPNQVRQGSGKKVWWLCAEGHEWEAKIYQRATVGSNCPYCAGKAVCSDNSLRTRNPALASQWHSTKNENLTPDHVTLFSSKRAWWICEQGHEWNASIASRSQKSNCPVCSGKKPKPVL